MRHPVRQNDTIAAIATPPGRGAIGIVRLSGPRAVEIASRLFRGGRDPIEAPSHAVSLGWLEHEGRRIDEVLCLVMRGPKSYTAEDVVELHCHGGPAVLKAALAAVTLEGARPAEPGEFTRRAFLAGRIDLAQAEAVAELIAAETDAAARIAASRLGGAVSERVQALKDRMVETLALLEAGLDFADEEDVVAIAPAELEARLADFGDKLAALIEEERRGRVYREGARVAIVGKPNVGKSTLLNALLGADRAIVTPEPGTTRDLIEDLIELEGAPVRLQDTAGVRPARTEAERLGVDRALAAAKNADLALLVVDGSAALTDEDREVAAAIDRPALVVVNKSDLPAADAAGLGALIAGAATLQVSALTGAGISALKSRIAAELLGGAVRGEGEASASARRLAALAGAREETRSAGEALGAGLSDEFIAAPLRRGLDRIGLITGETATAELLDLIFSRFCVGK